MAASEVVLGVRPAALGLPGAVLSPRGPSGSPSFDACVREWRPLPLRKRHSHSPGGEAREERADLFLQSNYGCSPNYRQSGVSEIYILTEGHNP